MKISVLISILALCLLAFAANANSKSIELNSAEIDNIVNIDTASKSAEENKLEPDDADSNSKDDDSKSAEEVIEDHNEGDSDSRDDNGSESELTVTPVAQDPEVVNTKKMVTYVKDLMFMVDQMMSSVIDKLSESTAAPEGHEHTVDNIEEVHKYVKDFMSMVEKNIISIIDTVSELTAAPEGHEHTVDNIEQVHKYVKDLMSMLEQKLISVIDTVSESTAAPEGHEHTADNVEEVHKYVNDLISVFEHKIMDIIGEEEEKPVPIQSRTLNTLKWTLKSILKTLRGVNCTANAVVNVKESTEQMLTNLQECGVETTKQIQAVLDSAQQVFSISNDIISINENECGNSDYLVDVDVSEQTPPKCVKQLSSKVRSLIKQISKTAKFVKKVPTDAGDCVSTIFSNYQQEVVGFPDFVKTCGKL